MRIGIGIAITAVLKAAGPYVPPAWILALGAWNNNGAWDDADVWKDAP
jgi:hypothetical protein